MGSLWKKSANEYESSAKVVDGNLILSLPDAINPVVWRMELGSVKASAMEVRNPSADGSHMLALKTPKGEVHDIAPYLNREQAIQALMRISSALQSAEGKFTPAANYTQPNQTARTTEAATDSPSYKWLFVFGGVLSIIILFAYLSSLTPHQSNIAGSQSTATSVTGESNAESGVPQSADEMLKGF